MPVARLADVVDTTRKQVYGWLDGDTVISPREMDRLRTAYSLLSGEADGTLRFFCRFWNRVLGLPTLKEALLADPIPEDTVRLVMDKLRPAVTDAMVRDTDRKADNALRPRSPAGWLGEYLEVGSR